VPKLWNQTVEAHRREVRDAILDTTAALVAEHGLRPVTMSQIAEQTGIGRATLYKYFSDVEAILVAWHDRHVSAHLAHLAAVRDRIADPTQRVESVLTACAHINFEVAKQHHGAELTALLHHDQHIAAARRRLHTLIRDVLADGAKAHGIRHDLPADELATFCQHALAAVSDLPSKAAIGRLVTVTMSALKPQGDQ
jgi:AcrR family transcriptional regulator